ncbi:MAG: cytochrome b5-like heme/steroid binding domain-containing protein [Patescibacteria group bacterium]
MDLEPTQAPQNKSNKMLIVVSLVAGVIVVAGIVFFTGNKDQKSNNSTQRTSNQSNSEINQNSSNGDQIEQEIKFFTKDDVIKHNSKSDCWTIIEDQVYDLTKFIGRHPGGDEIIRACGTDGTSLFTERKTEDGEAVGSGTPHSTNASSELQSLKIGDLKQ